MSRGTTGSAWERAREKVAATLRGMGIDAENGRVIAWLVLSCVGIAGGPWIQSHVNTFSFVWWLMVAVEIASLPGAFIIALCLAILVFWLVVGAGILVLIAAALYILFWLIRYFIQNPW